MRHDNHRGRTAGHGGAHWRLSPQSVWAIVKRYARQVGIPATTHHFRHSKASVLLNRGASLSEVQDILGHASPDTTKRIYAHYEVAHLRDAFDRYSASAEELVAELPRTRLRSRVADVIGARRPCGGLQHSSQVSLDQVLRPAVVRLLGDLRNPARS